MSAEQVARPAQQSLDEETLASTPARERETAAKEPLFVALRERKLCELLGEH